LFGNLRGRHMKRLIVVGSGLAGLSAGYRLHEQGWQVTVLESLGRVGGRVLSESEDGFLFDVGPTLITDKYTEYMKLVADVGLSDQLVYSATEMAVVKGDDLYILDTRKPLRSFLTTKLLPARAKLRLLVNGLRLIKPVYRLNPYDLSNRVQYDNQSIATYADRVFGRELNELLVGALTRSMSTRPPEQASVVELFAAAVVASGTMQNIKGGLQLLPIRLAAQLNIRLNSPVTAVRRTERGVEVQYENESGALTVEQADACVIATRFQDAANMYPPLKQAGADLLEATKYFGVYSVQLGYARRPDKEPFIVVVPTTASREVCTVFLEHMKAPDRAPTGTSHITALFPLQSGIDFSTWNDDRLITTAREFIERLFPELHGHFRTAHLTRWSYAGHQGGVGYYKALQRFLNSYAADDPVQVAGDYLAVAGQESAVVAGVNAAKRILAAQSNPATPDGTGQVAAHG
jgi:protoporphyrinogen/coproporphyrinogen III oxidase